MELPIGDLFIGEVMRIHRTGPEIATDCGVFKSQQVRLPDISFLRRTRDGDNRVGRNKEIEGGIEGAQILLQLADCFFEIPKCIGIIVGQANDEPIGNRGHTGIDDRFEHLAVLLPGQQLPVGLAVDKGSFGRNVRHEAARLAVPAPHGIDQFIIGIQVIGILFFALAFCCLLQFDPIIPRDRKTEIAQALGDCNHFLLALGEQTLPRN